MNDDNDKESGKLIEFKKKKPAQKPVDWKITYQIKRSAPKKKVLNDKVLFWIKFVAYIALVTYGMKQCGF